MFLSCGIVFATTTESQFYGSHFIRCATVWPPGCPIVSASEPDPAYAPELFAEQDDALYSHARKGRGRLRRGPSAKPFIVNDLKFSL
jgi:hypothetical protein